MKNTVIRCLYFLVALVCVLVSLTSCKKSVDIDNSSSEPAKIVEPVVSEPEDVSSIEETVSEPEVSAPVETASEVQKTQSSTTTTKKQTSSKTNTQKQQATQQTQHVQQDTRPVNTWTCPDPSAHHNYPSSADCLSQSDHEHLIEKSRKIDETNAVAAQQLAQKAAAHGMTVEQYSEWSHTHCPLCERPIGDGHNGTCNPYYANGTNLTCQHD